MQPEILLLTDEEGVDDQDTNAMPNPESTCRIALFYAGILSQTSLAKS